MTYKKPDGTETKSLEQYLRAWRKIYRPIEEATGFTCTGFDPSLAFSKLVKIPNSNCTDYQSSFQMPVAFAQKLIEFLNENI